VIGSWNVVLYSYVYKTIAGSVMLYLQHDFYNIIFKIKHKLHIVSGSAPPPRKNPGCMPGLAEC
jgi:hypothetical protein